MPPLTTAHAPRFSKVAVINRHPSGYWSLTMRVANLRKHQILQPSIRMVRPRSMRSTSSHKMHASAGADGTASI